MNAATISKCRALRNETIRLGFTREQFDRMVKVARGWADCCGSWHNAALAVRNTCVTWKTPAAMRSSGCELGRCL